MTTNAVLHTGGAALVGIQGSDNVTLITAGAMGAFDTKNVGTNKNVTVSGLTISGADATNYTSDSAGAYGQHHPGWPAGYGHHGQ